MKLILWHTTWTYDAQLVAEYSTGASWLYADSPEYLAAGLSGTWLYSSYGWLNSETDYGWFQGWFYVGDQADFLPTVYY